MNPLSRSFFEHERRFSGFDALEDFGEVQAMTKATTAQAKTRLGALIDAAMRGERVVIMCGSKPVAAIVPVDRNGSQALRVTDAAADYLAHEACAELEAGVAQVYESPATFAAAITKPRRRA